MVVDALVIDNSVAGTVVYLGLQTKGQTHLGRALVCPD